MVDTPRKKVKNSWSKHQSVKVDEEQYGDFYQYIDDADQWIDPTYHTNYDNIYTPVWRWRQAFFNDCQCRMDWCVQSHDHANHQPVAAINGDQEEKIHVVSCKTGETVSFDASGTTDPDGDVLQYVWWIYPEAGSYPASIVLEDANGSNLSFDVPGDAKGREIHLILQVNDQNEIASLADYRRIVLQVQ